MGDDDQSIYGWSGASVEFIRRFRDDYRAEVHHLVACYRSSAHILAAAERLIAKGSDRMKHDVAIRVDDARASDPPGGPWAALDPEHGGRVAVLTVDGAATQAAALAERLLHMKRLDPDLDWRDCAVLARRHAELEPIRAALEHRDVPVAWTADRDRLPTLYRIRELATLLDTLKSRRQEILRASQIKRLLDPATAANPWSALAGDLLDEWHELTGNAKLTVKNAIEFLYESLAERARDTAFGDGVRLSTVHAAKGLEFRAVFLPDGAWGSAGARGQAEDVEEQRRIYYVGMTRARELLHLFARSDLDHPFLADLGEGNFLDRRAVDIEPPPDAVARRRYRIVGLQDLYLSFAGCFLDTDPIHQRLAALEPGTPLTLREAGKHLRLYDAGGDVVAALAAAAAERWRERLHAVESVKVVAMVKRRAEDNEPEYRERLRCERWEVPVVEVAYRG